MGIVRELKKVKSVAMTPVMNSKQLETIKQKKKAYLANMGSVEGAQERVKFLLGEAAVEIYQEYLDRIGEMYVPIHKDFPEEYTKSRIRSFNISRLVTDKEEKSLDKLVNVYQVLSEEQCNIALIYDRAKDTTNVSIGVINSDLNRPLPKVANAYYERIRGALEGNFPGVEIVNENPVNGIPITLQKIENSIHSDEKGIDGYNVAIVSNIASEKSIDYVSQSMEKLLDGIVPKEEKEEYTIILLASPVADQLEKINKMYELYGKLSPLATWQTSYSNNESHSEGVSKTLGENFSVAKTKSVGVSKGPISAGISKSTSFGISFSESSTTAIQVGKSEALTQTYTNYNVKHLMEIIENQISRYEEGAAMGMWEFAAYVVSKSPTVANNVAHMYLALTQGEESYRSKSIVKLFDNGDEMKKSTNEIINYIVRLQHPSFGMEDYSEDNCIYPAEISPSVNISGLELAKALNLPRKSVAGLAVYEAASFGREVRKFDDNVEGDKYLTLGNTVHMGRKSELSEVYLDVDSLAMHTFVTGSTGTGKSNVIYKIIDELDRYEHIHYMVVEPAKGEYKTVFGKDKSNCTVYSTNPDIAELLRLNPFSFPEGVHVLEHIDRFVELINSCWPMYAAMPAVLKSAIEEAYINSGWNLETNECDFYGRKRFPTFYDLIESLPNVIELSGYSADTTSDYKGALYTRIKSLTDGINGKIFCSSDELSEENLFEKNVIIDLSRIGSLETKSLIMAIVFMKLQEYRLCTGTGFNEPLKHVTVLEEAHHLLRRTSMEQNQEMSNLQGKSVEMITNAIAEMRSYGEGFIIADQAPGLLDEAVLRNTNTKIILRSPNAKDRELVGKSCALNDTQILEISRLPVGTAVVYQNNWIEPVLCSVEMVDRKPAVYNNKAGKSKSIKEDIKIIEKVMGKCFLDKTKLTEEEVDKAFRWIDSLKYKMSTKRLLFRAVTDEILDEKEKGALAYNLFKGKNAYEKLIENVKNNDIEGTDLLTEHIRICYPDIFNEGSKDKELLSSVLNSLRIQIKSIMEKNGINDEILRRNNLY